MKKINTITVVIIAFVSFFFISCGGEGPDDPIDTDPTDNIVIVDDTEPTDNVEPVDNEMPDDVQTDDIQDTEPNDDDNLLTDEEPDTDQPVNIGCKNINPKVASWEDINIPETDYEMDLSAQEVPNDCETTIAWTKGWDLIEKFYGTSFPLKRWDENMGKYVVVDEDGDGHLVRKIVEEDGTYVPGNELIMQKK